MEEVLKCLYAGRSFFYFRDETYGDAFEEDVQRSCATPPNQACASSRGARRAPCVAVLIIMTNASCDGCR